MPKTSSIRQILSDPKIGLLSYIRYQLQTEEFSKFEAQLSFQAQESRTQVKQGDSLPELQTRLSISLLFLIILHMQIDTEQATLLALDLQDMLEASLVQWSMHNPQLLLPIEEINASFGRLEEVRYKGGYLPGLTLNLKFDLIYSTDAAEVEASFIALSKNE